MGCDAAGRYFVSFMVEETLPASRRAPAPNTIGAVDLGLSSFVVDAQGHRVAPLRALHRLRRADRALKRRRRGSGRCRAQQRRIARLHAGVADARANFLHPVSRRIVAESQVLVTETLNVRGMLRNRCLARAIADAGWGELRSQIAYKAGWAERTHVQVDPWFPSTRRCRACHARREGLTLAQRRWRCEACGAEHDRDFNAARNLGQLRVVDKGRMASATHEDVEVPVFEGRIIIDKFVTINAERALGASLSRHNTIALIGRDLLEKAVFHYNDPDGSFSLAI